MTIQNKEQLYVFHDFVDEQEIIFWNSVMDNPDFWEGSATHPGIVDYYNDRMPNDLIDAEQNLVERICARAELVYGDDLITETIPSFRRYMATGRLDMHFDHGDSLWVDEPFKFGLNDYGGTYWPRGFNEYSTSLYWNNDFTGGEICFQNPAISIKPTAGMLIMFPCTEKYAHAVNEVTSGERRTTSHFWSKARTVAMVLSNLNISANIPNRRFMHKVDRLLGNGPSK